MRLVWLFVLLACAMVAAIQEDSPQPRTPRALPGDAPPRSLDAMSGQPRAERHEPESAEVVAVEAKKEQIVEEEPGDSPDDPVELGDCSLMIHVSDKATQRPIEAAVQIWRLDAPGNENWERGDQLQKRVEIPKVGLRIDDLPAGRYRIYSTDQRIKSEDPPEFSVDGFLTTVRVQLAMPREFSVHVRIYTVTGHLLMRAMRDDLTFSTSFGDMDKYPEWRTGRASKNGVLCLNISIGLCGGCNLSAAYEVVGSEEGFDLGSYREDARGSRRTSFHRFASEGRSEVSVHLTRDVQRDRTYIALSVPTEPIVASIVMPDGNLAQDAGAKIRMWCSAKLGEPDDSEGAWRKLPIRVRARLKGYETLEFEYRPGDTLPLRTLQSRIADKR